MITVFSWRNCVWFLFLLFFYVFQMIYNKLIVLFIMKVLKNKDINFEPRYVLSLYFEGSLILALEEILWKNEFLKKRLIYKDLWGERKLFNPKWVMMDSRRGNLDTNIYLYRINRFQFHQIRYINLTDNATLSRESYFPLEKQLLLNIFRMQYVNFWKEKKYLCF